MRHRSCHARRLPWGTAGLGAAALLAILGTSACGGTSSTASTASTATSSAKNTAGLSFAKAQVAEYSGVPATTAAIAAVTRTPSLRGKTVWYVPVGGSVPIMQVAGSAMADALGRLGVTVHTCDGNFLPTTAAQCLNQAATQGAAAVITAYVDYNEIPTAFNNLVSHHIPVLVGAENKPGDATSSDLGFLSFDALNGKVARLVSDAVIADSGGHANVLALRLTDSAATAAASDQAIAELRQHCPGCTVYTLNTEAAQLSRLPSSVSAELTQHPGIGYATGLDDEVSSITAGIASAGQTGR